ncbi:LAG1 longevity assurance-like protein [Medicago truncatula]|uniref:LAG1 longevity assurance-like protein n=1 Tax=Medicago truncatula TaxID=3880 RepID=A0A072UET0_MEDTR|nr:LAG1 longevity assurance-like protein [Medicago truncatula]
MKVARRLIFRKGHDVHDFQTDDRRKKIRKFKESAWKCVYFLSAEIFAISVTYDEPWFTDTKYFWVGPGNQIWPDQKIKLKLKGLYMYGAGFYSYSILALIFWETRRSDFRISMTHHVVSLSLIVLSYIFRFVRIGSVVLALHDASDVFLEIGKMAIYSSAESIASFAFILFVLSWTILRIIYYPFWVLRSTSYEVIDTLKLDKHLVDYSIHYHVFNTLLFCLLVLNIYWWVLMLRMLVGQICAKGKVSEDIRSAQGLRLVKRRHLASIELGDFAHIKEGVQRASSSGALHSQKKVLNEHQARGLCIVKRRCSTSIELGDFTRLKEFSQGL